MADRRKRLSSFFDDFHRIEEEMDRLFEELGPGDLKDGEPLIYGINMRRGPEGEPVIERFGNVKSAPGGKNLLSEAREPLVDVIEREKDITVMAELPGVDKGDIKLRLSGGSLVIEASRRGEAAYYRAVELPAKVRKERAKATCKNGVLEVVLSKVRPSEPDVTELKVE
jgi:HSP20 family protein